MINPLARLPASLKETITLQRRGGGVYGDEVTDLAKNVECWIVPEDSYRSNQVVVENGVPVRDFFFTVHLAEPIEDVIANDFIVRSDESELRVFRPIPYGDVVMKLIARQRGVL